MQNVFVKWKDFKKKKKGKTRKVHSLEKKSHIYLKKKNYWLKIVDTKMP